MPNNVEKNKSFQSLVCMGRDRLDLKPVLVAASSLAADDYRTYRPFTKTGRADKGRLQDVRMVSSIEISSSRYTFSNG